MKNAHMICHTFSNSVWLNYTDYYAKKDLILYYDIVGNLASCSLPYALWDMYKGEIPKGECFTFMAAAAGGS
jgi:hypothetical protein